MSKCSEPYCERERYFTRPECEMHWKRKWRLRRKAGRRIPKPVKHDRKMFDLSTLGAVGWRVRS